ncbi:phosphatidylinositol 3 [Apiospora arundinis]
MRAQTTLLSLFGLLASVGAEMKMKSPKPITKQGSEGPCGNMDPFDRSKVENWPIRGHDVGLKFFDHHSYVTLQATVIDEGSIEEFRDLRPQVHMPRADDYCFMRIRGIKEWIGKDVLFQAKQYVPGKGYNFTCAAVKFVKGGPHKPTCRGFHDGLVKMVANPLDHPPTEDGDGQAREIEAREWNPLTIRDWADWKEDAYEDEDEDEDENENENENEHAEA